MRVVKALRGRRITLPEKRRNALGIKEGDILIIEKTGEGMVLKKGKNICDYTGILPKPYIPLEEVVESSIEEAVKERREN